MPEWFEVSKDGLKALQDGKSKTFIMAELIQNALDEDVENITVEATYYRNLATISVEDDSPTGFRDLKDAYTLFAPCYKSPDPEKRGRFNAGEKQVFSISKSALIETTSGTIVFDSKGRHTKRAKREVGSKITIEVAMTKAEFQEIVEYVNLLILPINIIVTFNNNIVKPKMYDRDFTATLQTEHLKGDKFAKTNRKTQVQLFDTGLTGGCAYIYEMGIPVCKIECEYSVNVNQRIPMGMDRDMVSQAYLKDLFAEVLNHTFDKLTSDNASNTWVRIGMSDDRVSEDAVKQVVKQRYGDNPLVATVGDAISNSDAIANGHRLIHGSEMSGDEWDNIRRFDALDSTADKYGRGTCDWDDFEPLTKGMVMVEKLAKKIARLTLGRDINVRFIECESSNTHDATFGLDGLTFYVSSLGENWFKEPLNYKVINLIIHELGHDGGHHHESGYHRKLTRIGAKLTLEALNNPEFFDEFKGEF